MFAPKAARLIKGAYNCKGAYNRDVIKQHLPKVFEGRLKSVRCIIDCTEIKCEKPQDLQKQSELYSEFKSHNTFKGLVGISPNVWMTFVSGLYGGSISDR